MNREPFRLLLSLLNRLSEAKITYQLRHSRNDAIMVLVYAPGQYWEIDITSDGEVEIERYHSEGEIDDESSLDELFELWSDEPAINATKVGADDAVARK